VSKEFETPSGLPHSGLQGPQKRLGLVEESERKRKGRVSGENVKPDRAHSREVSQSENQQEDEVFTISSEKVLTNHGIQQDELIRSGIRSETLWKTRGGECEARLLKKKKRGIVN